MVLQLQESIHRRQTGVSYQCPTLQTTDAVSAAPWSGHQHGAENAAQKESVDLPVVFFGIHTRF